MKLSIKIIKISCSFRNFRDPVLIFSFKFSTVRYEWHYSQITQQNKQVANNRSSFTFLPRHHEIFNECFSENFREILGAKLRELLRQYNTE